MLAKRLLVINIFVPIFVLVIVLGGWTYTSFILLFLAFAAWEYWRIFKSGGYAPALPLMIAGTTLLVAGRMLWDFKYIAGIFSVIVLAAMGVHVLDYERGRESSGVDFGITLGGIFYLGWLGSYFIALRNLPSGMWWSLLVIPSIWLADSGAFLIGRRFGRHPFSARVSPNKTWEGYLGGILFGTAGTLLLALLWQLRDPTITPLKGLILGCVIAIITPIGDLGESMIKRQFGLKDSGKLLPGHGGVLDRIDSWLWAAVIGYYLILYLG